MRLDISLVIEQHHHHLAATTLACNVQGGDVVLEGGGDLGGFRGMVVKGGGSLGSFRRKVSEEEVVSSGFEGEMLGLYVDLSWWL